MALFNAYYSILAHGLPVRNKINTPQQLRFTVYSMALELEYRCIPRLMKKYPLPAPDIADLLEPYANVAGVYQLYSLDVVYIIVYQNVNDLLIAISKLSNRDDYFNVLIARARK